MKKQKLFLFATLITISTMFCFCEKSSNSIYTDSLDNFNIKSIEKELQLLSKSLIPIIQNKRNVEIIKEAIYNKKRDENITLKDLFDYHSGLITKPGNGNERVISLEQQILNNINQYQAMTLEELRDLVETYDMSLYWEYIQLWDGTTLPKVGYPTNEEEDINHNYDLMSYKIFTSTNDVEGTSVIRSYLKENPIILVRPLENFENGGEAYHGDVDYVWLGDLKESVEEDGEVLRNLNNGMKISNISEPSVTRLKEFTTSGNVYDGSGGPEFRFGRVGSEQPLQGVSTFTHKITMNLTASVANQNIWYSLAENPINLSDIWDYDWKIKKETQHFGCYEQDGGLNNKTNYLFAEFVDIGGFISILINASVGVGIKLQKRDDIIHRTIIQRSTYVNYYLNGYNFEGVRNGKSIISFNNEVPNNDLKIVLSDI